MSDDEWNETESFGIMLNSLPLNCGVTQYTDGGNRPKNGLWKFNGSTVAMSNGPGVIAVQTINQVFHVASCRMKILRSSDFISPEFKSNTIQAYRQEDVIVGGQNLLETIILDARVQFTDARPSFHIDFQRSKSCPCPYCEQKSSLSKQISILSTALNAYESLVSSTDSTDVVFEVSGVKIPAHKAILSVRYDYFKALFSSDWLESKTDHVMIPDVDVEKFKQMLRFIYCGKLPANLQSDAAAYLPIANKYGIEDLESACSDALKLTLTADNVSEIFALADLYQCKDLARACLDKMIESPTPQNVAEILTIAQRYEYQNVKEECFRKIREWKTQGVMDAEMLEAFRADPDLLMEIIMKI